ncbi:MAG TPA: HipA N-terminal domain-containing protein [Ignavibacteria bacterium]|nr:HipA N-terminal domain-containing protein [Ignavibacteria bacterium]
MNRKGLVYYKNIFAGTIEQTEDGIIFTYDEEYIQNHNIPISLTMPVKKESYTSKFMFPFFDGLIPEGWLLEITEKNWKVDRRDRMGLLLAVCKDCIGAVGIFPEEQ